MDFSGAQEGAKNKKRKMTVHKQHEEEKGKKKAAAFYAFAACQQGDHRPDRKCIRNRDIIHILVIKARAVVIHISQ